MFNRVIDNLNIRRKQVSNFKSMLSIKRFQAAETIPLLSYVTYSAGVPVPSQDTTVTIHINVALGFMTAEHDGP